jgi:fatty acid desaturase
MAATQIESPLARLSDEQIEEIGAEFQKIHDEVFDDLGERDAKYIHSIIDLQRKLALGGRLVLFGSRFWPAWIVGTSFLSLAKILENMEIGHNVMHGQWDWMNDPQIHSSEWDWDTASTKEAWKHSHNYIHHTYTNIRGKDKDLGYEVMRIDPHQKWHPAYLLQPLYNLLLMAFFEWGVAFHDMDIEAIRAGEKSHKEALKDLRGIWGKARTQIVKDYTAWPLISAVVSMGALALWKSPLLDELRPTPSKRARAKSAARSARNRAGRMVVADAVRGLARSNDLDTRVAKLRHRVERSAVGGSLLPFADRGRATFKATLWANFTANIVRNVWAHSIIFCGHFPDQTYTFTQEEVEDETKGGWYVRQLIGAANIDGSALFHVISGNLGYQVEHHLYPDMPSTRYGEIAPRVREVCQKYGLPYNTGPFHQQLGQVHRTIIRLGFPGGKPRTKPGAYEGPLLRGSGEGVRSSRETREAQTAAA